VARLLVAPLLVSLALVVGCGGSEQGAASGGESAASIVPATVPVYVSIDTDVESDQWRQADELLGKFPGRERLLAKIREALSGEGVDFERDVEGALGPIVDVAVLDVEADEPTVVGLTQPEDEAKFQALLRKGDDPAVSRVIEDWTAFSDSEDALDRFEAARGGDSLADSEEFVDAMGKLPEEALAKLYVNGDALSGVIRRSAPGTLPLPTVSGKLVSAAAALEAEEDGVGVKGVAATEDASIDAPELGALLEVVPEDAIAFVNFHGYDGQLKLTEQITGSLPFPGALDELERMLGVELEDISTLFNREGLLYVRPGLIIPEVTLVLEVQDERAAARTLDALARRIGPLSGETVRRSSRTIDGIEATVLDLGDFSVFYAVSGGRLVVTTQAAGVKALAGGGDKLVDSDRYEDARTAAGVEDGEDVFVYVDLEEAISLVGAFAQLGGESVPDDVAANLEPLESLVVAGRLGDEESTFRVFVGVE
jgi:hypothetical protein